MIIGRSSAIRRALALAERYGSTRLPILLLGETGTGKEELARHVHALSGRTGKLVDLNCAGLREELADSLLFGHRRGAFTGAVESAVGHLERADGGTLFLDELPSLPPQTQAKLLRAIETGEVQPLGAPGKRRLDLRVVAAAHDELPDRVADGLFRRDLYQRLAGVVIRLPPLADRLEDVVPIGEHFAAEHQKRVEAPARVVLENYRWPGNVRELRQVIERACLLVGNGTLPAAAIREAIDLGAYGAPPLPSTSKACLLADCAANAWDARRIAQARGVSRATLFRELRAEGIRLRENAKVSKSHDVSQAHETLRLPGAHPST